MTTDARTVQVYEALANWYDRQGQAKLRDWFLVLAADAARSAGQQEHAEHLRQRLLHVNPHHLLRPFGSFAEAVQSPDVRGYIADLRRTYPPDSAEQLLQTTQKQAPPGTAEGAAPLPARDTAPELKVVYGQDPATSRPLPRPSKDAAPRPSSWPIIGLTPLPTPRPAMVVDDDEETGLAYWVPTLLFDLLLLGGLALAVYLFVRPFLVR